MCLGSGHGAHDCSSKVSCKSCGKRHHTSLCKGTAESNGLIANARATTLLQTAKVKAFNPQTRRNVFVRIVLDLGSNDSYITDRLKKQLSLPTVGSHRLRISGFGGASNGSRTYPMTSLTLRSRFGGDTLPFSAFVVPKIASSINPSFHLSKLGELASLDLADDFEPQSDEVDILVGVDQHHRFVTGEMKRGTGGPVATNSVFGWLVSGPVSAVSGDVSNSFFLSSRVKATNDEDLVKFWEVEEKRTKRCLLKGGKNKKLILGRKDIERGSIVSLGDGKQNIRRPLELLYPLETRGWGSFTLSGKPKTDHERPHEKRITKEQQQQVSVSVGEDNRLRSRY